VKTLIIFFTDFENGVKIVLLQIPDFRDRDFRIFKPILKKGFESDADLLDPNPQIPQKDPQQ
jgi:hypothetical protein